MQKRGKRKRTHLSGPPDLEVADLINLLLKRLAVVWAGVELERALSLATVLDAVVEVVEDGLEGVLELLLPVEGAAASGGRAGLVHVVESVLYFGKEAMSAWQT